MAYPSVLVDAHVHFHDAFELGRFFDCAIANFEQADRALGLTTRGPGVLMLAECSGVDCFESWSAAAEGQVACGDWCFADTREPRSLLVQREGRTLLVVVAGRQLVTSEGLEVLALGVRGEFGDGRTIEATLEAVRSAGGLPVLPWGVGKWAGRRGKIVTELLRTRGDAALFLGDNGGRPALLPRPALLSAAERSGVPVLPGSDPLPLAGQEQRVGAFGFATRVGLDLAEPARRLLDHLRADPNEIRAYGSGTGWGGFVWAQAAMQIRKRRRPAGR